MKNPSPIADCRLPLADQASGAASPLDAGAQGIARPTSSIVNRKSKIVNGFTLIEVLVVVVLLSLIVFALMAVFNTTQTAFRASVTQADVLESGRAAMDLMTEDLRAMVPSDGVNNGAVNFYAGTNAYQQPLVQPMVGGNSQRQNILETFFILSRQNQTWTGVGYAVNASSSSPLYPLYRFSMSTNIAFNPWWLYYYFTNAVASPNGWTNMSHLMDGVVALTVRGYDVNGSQMTTNIIFSAGQNVTNKNVLYFPPAWGQVGFIMFSNTLPASVEIEMGVLEDRSLQRAESLSGNFRAQTNYLAGSAGQVHVFRQRVSIPNVDPAAYQ